jgi:hypothetical protein
MASRPLVFTLLVVTAPLLVPAAGHASDAGQVKVVRGAAWIERAGTRVPAQVGARVAQSDVVVTGADGSLGITFADDSRLSIGPNSTLAIDRFAFDSTTHQGAFDTSLRKGTLSAVSGKLARQSPEAMTVKTPSAILGVRGTEFVVRTGEPAPGGAATPAGTPPR